MEKMKMALPFWVVCLFVTTLSWGQYTQIPDEVFEQYLINLDIDTEGILDGQVLTDDIDHITSLTMNPVFPEVDPLIHDLTGIEDFVALEFLNFGGNAVVNIDLSQNAQLRTLVCKRNSLESLDLSNNLLLERIDAANCSPGFCPNSNTFSTLDLSLNTNLEWIFMPRSQLTSIDLSNNPNINLITLFDSLDLENIIMDNGNNLAIETFRAFNTPSLVCIQVDDPDAATAGDTFPYDQWDIQDGVLFSNDCSLGVAEYLERNTIVTPNPTHGWVELSLPTHIEMTQWSILDVLGKKLMEGSSLQLDLSPLSGGLYTLVLETDKGSLVKKVVKQ